MGARHLGVRGRRTVTARRRAFGLCNAALVEKERRLISERTRAALLAKKERGEPLCNRTNLLDAQEKVRATNRANADAFAANVLPIVREIMPLARRTLGPSLPP